MAALYPILLMLFLVFTECCGIGWREQPIEIALIGLSDYNGCCSYVNSVAFGLGDVKCCKSGSTTLLQSLTCTKQKHKLFDFQKLYDVANNITRYECIVLSRSSVPSVYWTYTVAANRSTLHRCKFTTRGSCKGLHQPLPQELIPKNSVSVFGNVFRLHSQVALPSSFKDEKAIIRCVVNTSDMCMVKLEENRKIMESTPGVLTNKLLKDCYWTLLGKTKTSKVFVIKLMKIVVSLPKKCQSQVAKLICLFAVQRNNSLCREECFSLKLSVECRGVWQMLDSIWTEKLSNWPCCFKLPKCQRSTKLNYSENCHSENVTYMGFRNITANGHTCQHWNSQCPYAQTFHPNIYPELRNSKNWCRNPGNTRATPWCFITKSGDAIGWDFCDINKCDNNVYIPETLVISASREPAEFSIPWYFYCILIAILLILLSYFLWKHKVLKNLVKLDYGTVWYVESRENNYMQMQSMLDCSEQFDLMPNPDYYEMPLIFSLNNLIHIDRKTILFVRYLSEGAFGRVFVAKLHGQFIAVKTLKSIQCSQSDVESLANETKVLQLLNPHSNIVSIIGVNASQFPPFLLLEYMAFGDLKNFLLSCAEHNENDTTKKFSCDRLTDENLLWITVQALSGAAHVTNSNFIHRDLAARNCLLGPQLRLKLCDFGSCRSIEPNGFYRGPIDEQLPIRWLAPESFNHQLFSPSSDVWAFAVLMWEVFSGGKLPYYGLSERQVVEKIGTESRLEIPDRATSEIFDIMKLCWHHNPELRPNVGKLVEDFGQYYNSIK